jgi:hypothetical protein
MQPINVFEENKQLRLDLGLAELRAKQMEDRLAACGATLAQRDEQLLARSTDVEVLRKIVWGAVHNAGRRLTDGRVPRWSAVAEALGVESAVAHQLCRDHQLDPDELVGQGVDEEDEIA